jgi:hypothetical protein
MSLKLQFFLKSDNIAIDAYKRIIRINVNNNIMQTSLLGIKHKEREREEDGREKKEQQEEY